MTFASQPRRNFLRQTAWLVVGAWVARLPAAEAGAVYDVCVSASHIAMTSIRMEPVWMILGESAGVAASMAVKSGSAVQDVPYAELYPKLRALTQKVEIPKKKETKPK